MSLIAVAGGSLGACGDGSNDAKLLSRSSASELRSTLAQVEQSVTNGDCDGAQQQVSLLQQQIASLDSVEADLQDALVSGVSRLEQLVSEECQAPAAETGAAPDAGTTDARGTTAPDEQQSDEPDEGKGKGKKKGKEKKEGAGVEVIPDTGEDGGGSGGSGGTTGSGGFAP